MSDLLRSISHPGVTAAPLGSDLRDVLVRVRHAGIRAVQLDAAQPGLRPRELDRSARRGLLGILRRAEIECCGIDLWIPTAHFLDPNRIDRAVEAMMAALHLAADLEHCPLCCRLPRRHRACASSARASSTLPTQREIKSPSEAHDSNAPATDEVDAVVSAICNEAHRVGVDLVDHALPIELREGIQVGIDAAAALAAGEQPADFVHRYHRRETDLQIGSARLCDLTETGARRPVQRDGASAGGLLDLHAYRISLETAGYRGPVVIDARNWPEPWAGVASTLRAWQSVPPYPPPQ